MFLCTVPAGALADMLAPRRFLIVLETFVTTLMATFWSGHFLSLADSGLSALDEFRFERRLVALHAGVAVDYAATRAAARSRRRQRRQQRRLQHQPRDGPGSRGSCPRQTGTRRAVLDIRGRRFDVDRGAALVASPQENQLALYAGAIYRRGADRISACGQKQASAGHDDPNGRCLSVRFRLSRVAAADCAPSGGAAGPLFYCVLLAVVSVGAVLGSLALAWMRNRFGPDLVVALGTGGLAIALVLFGLARRSRRRRGGGADRGRGVDDRARGPLCIGADRIARLGARARAWPSS